MRSLAFKDGVKVKNFTPAIAHILMTLLKVMETHPWVPDLVITSINDSRHGKNSRHYTDEAVDVRIHYFKKDEDLDLFHKIIWHDLNNLNSCCFKEFKKDKFTVLIEDRGTPNQHIHIQVSKGEKWL